MFSRKALSTTALGPRCTSQRPDGPNPGHARPKSSPWGQRAVHRLRKPRGLRVQNEAVATSHPAGPGSSKILTKGPLSPSVPVPVNVVSVPAPAQPVSPTQGSVNVGTTAGHARAPLAPAAPTLSPARDGAPALAPPVLATPPTQAGPDARRRVGERANQRASSDPGCAASLGSGAQEGTLGICRGEQQLRGSGKGPRASPACAFSSSAVLHGLEDPRTRTDAGPASQRMRTLRLAPLRRRDWGAGARMRGGPRAFVGRCLGGWRRAMGRPALLLLALCAAGARGLYFHIGETEKRCFIEEIPDETMVIGQAGRGRTGPCVSPRRGHGAPRSVGVARSRRVVTALSAPQGTTAPRCGTSRRKSFCPRPRAWACMWR